MTDNGAHDQKNKTETRSNTHGQQGGQCVQNQDMNPFDIARFQSYLFIFINKNTDVSYLPHHRSVLVGVRS